MKKAISCLEKATNEEVNHGFDIFGRHIASELEAIPYPHLQRWAKLQIQQIIFTAENAGTSYIENLPNPSPNWYHNSDTTHGYNYETNVYSKSPEHSPHSDPNTY